MMLDKVLKMRKWIRSYSDMPSPRGGPLDGVRIIDLTRIVAGPYCSMILGDLGAEVIKVEHPQGGDEARKWGPPFLGEETCYFLSLNRNKRSICVDLKKPQGQQIIRELVQTSDVLMENFVPGVLEKLNLGFSSLKKVSSRLIYCSITGFGTKGRYKNKPGYDVIASSMGGLVNITGEKYGEPVKAAVPVTDITTGLYAHGAILAALLERAKTGRGQKVDVDLLSTQLSYLINVGSNYLNKGIKPERWGSSHPSIVPYRCFKTREGRYITIGAGSDKQFEDLCKRLNLNELPNDPRFKSNQDRVANRDLLDSLLESRFAEKKLSEWLGVLENASFPCGPVNTLSEVFDDAHVRDIDIVKEMNHSRVGSVKVVGPAVSYSESINEVRTAPPTLGEHTDRVLKGLLGYSEEQVDQLRKDGEVPTLRLKLKKKEKKVNWTGETIDNEHMDKKKSKCCCIYRKPRTSLDDSSSGEDETDCDHCFGHVEKKHQHHPTENPSASPPTDEI